MSAQQDVSADVPSASSIASPTIEERLDAACAEGIAANMQRWFHFVGCERERHDVLELQALEVPQRRGPPCSMYAHATSSPDVLRLLTEAEAWRPPAPALYQIINRLDPRVATRSQANEWHRADKRGSTSDRDVSSRVVLPIDFDVDRPKYTSTNAAEMACSVEVAAAVREQLVSALGDDRAIAYGHSGNGRWLALALDELPNVDDVRELVRVLLAGLNATHSTDQVKIDVALCDAKRLGPAWGTTKRKGMASLDRPHRATGIVVPAPGRLRRLSLAELRELSATLGSTDKGRKGGRKGAGVGMLSVVGPGHVSAFDLANSVPIRDVADELGMVDGRTIKCPRGCSGGTSVALLEDSNIHKCSRATCADVGPPGRRGGIRTCVDLWAEVRGIEPLAAAKAICAWKGIDVPDRPRRGRATPKPGARASAGSGGIDDAGGTDDARPTITLSPDEHLHVAEAIRLLAQHETTLFQRAGKLVQVVDDPERHRGARRIVPLRPERLATMIAEHIVVQCVVDAEGKLEHAHPPLWLTRGVIAQEQWPTVRILRGITEVPMLRPDGTILDTPGYDNETRMLYEPSVDVPAIADAPTKADAADACGRLLDVFSEFPFASGAHRSVVLSAVLAYLARPAIDGPVPLHFIEANVRGAGKSLAADVVALITTGSNAERMPPTQGEEEWRKRLLSILLSGRPLVLIDNVRGSFESTALDALLTGTSYSDRLLGKSEDVSVRDVRTLWLATGNNASIAGDLARRMLLCRLMSTLENPEERADLKRNEDELRSHIREHRGKLVAAGLTMLRAWYAAGCPHQTMKAMGSFAAYSSIVRQTIVFAGQPDPGDVIPEIRDRSDREGQSARELVTAWRSVFGDAWMKAGEVIRKCWPSEPALLTEATQTLREQVAALCRTKGDGKPHAVGLGMRLRQYEGRVVAGLTLETEIDPHARSTAFRVVATIPTESSPLAGSDGLAELAELAELSPVTLPTGAYARTHMARAHAPVTESKGAVGKAPQAPQAPRDDLDWLDEDTAGPADGECGGDRDADSDADPEASERRW